MGHRSLHLIWLCVLSACQAFTLQTAPPQPQAVRDDKLEVDGRVCSDIPQPLEFPLKVMFIIDVSQSMNVTDPPPPTCTAAACFARRGLAVEQVLDKYPGGNGLEYALMIFNSTSNLLTNDASGNPGFTPISDLVKAQIPQLNLGTSETNYEGALSLAFDKLQTDMLALDTTARSRAKYIIIFMSDGLPAPVTADFNTNERIIADVNNIKKLQTDQRLADVELHTVYLAGPNTPDAVQLVSKNLLEDMSRAGGGTFRAFASGEPISFFYIDFRAFIRTFAMKSLVVANHNQKSQKAQSATDSDGDGLLDTDEIPPGTDPTNPDTDGDGFGDLLEVRLRGAGFDPNFSGDADCTLPLDKGDDDGDGLRNCEERFIGSNPRLVDSDADGVADDVEFRAGTNPADSDVLNDVDFDGIPTGVELAAHTDPNFDDSGELSKIGYRYTITELPGNTPDLPQGQRCYDFQVANITLAPTLAIGGGKPGSNIIWLQMDSAPQDSPDDFGNYKFACIMPRYELSPERKFPPNGKMTVPLEAFKLPAAVSGATGSEVFDAERDCIQP